ncbi:hypothetical protein [Nonomuraea sp. NPDC023979]|uniref:hypothetical protein n=1 Tax=Nonomuraea sp. NPDC023979 TaxID=3154796 RepID=UPI0033D3C72A
MTPADVIRDAVALMRCHWRVRGDFVVGWSTIRFGVCPVAAFSVVAGDVFVRGAPLGQVPIVQETIAWLVDHHRLPRSRREAELGVDDPALAYLRVAEWADSFPEDQDDRLFRLMETAAKAWRPEPYPKETLMTAPSAGSDQPQLHRERA